MSLLAPSILAADFSNLSSQIRAAELGNADLIHCDIMDGRFVPNITFGPKIVSTVSKMTKLPLDVHLMIVKPENYFEEFVKAGADMISFHIEASTHLHRSLQLLKTLGVKAGVVLNPHTPIALLEDCIQALDLFGCRISCSFGWIVFV